MTENDPDILPFEALSRVIMELGMADGGRAGITSVQGWLDSGMLADFADRPPEMQKVAFATACMAINRAMALATQMLYPHGKEHAQRYLDYILGAKPMPQEYMSPADGEAEGDST